MPNGNERGSNLQRQRRREWLLETFRADVDVVLRTPVIRPEDWHALDPVPLGEGQPACRCYRCGCLLTITSLTVDRVVPGAHGGTYRRNNIRPACLSCNSSTGAVVRRPAARKLAAVH